jgi:hypothetical protein
MKSEAIHPEKDRYDCFLTGTTKQNLLWTQ